jgi:hypothetical protein
MVNQNSRVVATYSHLKSAGKGLDRLILAGFPVAQVFLVGENLQNCVDNGTAHSVQLVEQIQTGAITGTALGLTKGLVTGNLVGGATGVLLGLGILALPGIGQIAFTSAAVFTLISGGICTAAGGMIGALVGLGLTENQVKKYRQQLAKGNYLLVVLGTESEIQSAERILSPQAIRG